MMASRSLLYRAGWNEPLTTEAAATLQRWYDANWCVDALLVALERKPDNTKQGPRGSKELHRYLENRLQAWFDDDADLERDARLAPPRSGYDMQTWRSINTEHARRSGTRPAQRLGEKGKQAREEARAQASKPQRDLLAEVHSEDDRMTRALDSLTELLPAKVAERPAVDDPDAVAASKNRSQLYAAYAGRTATVSHDPLV